MAKYLDQNGSKRLVDNVKTSHTALNTKINSEMVARQNFATDVASSISALDERIGDNADYVKTIAVAGTTLSITSGTGDTVTLKTQDTTYDNATTSKAGLMSSSDKAKLDGIAANANYYTLPSASTSTKGGVKIGSGISVSSGTISVPEAMTSKAGLMSSSDKTKLDGIATGAQVNAIEEFWVDGVKQTITNKKISLDLSGKVDAISGKGLSTNDYTTAEKTKLAGIETSAEINAIDEVWIDGTKQTVTNKKVSLDLSDYVKGSDVASALRYKGSVNAVTNLPTSASTGDVYNVQTAGGTDGNGNAIKAGDNVVRTSDGKWDVLAGTVDLSNYVEKVTGKGLSTNDFTTAEKTKLAGIATGANAYTLPTATSSTLGGVKIGSGINISSGVISVPTVTSSANGLMSSSDKTKLDGLSNYTLPTASASSLGGVKIGSGINISGGVISVPTVTSSANGLMSSSDKTKLDGLSNYTLPTASASTLGGVKIGSGINISSGTISLAAATSSSLGGVKVGSGISVSSGTISVPNATSSTAGIVKIGTGLTATSGTVSLAAATSSSLGGVKVGSGLAVSSGTVSLAAATTSSLGGVKIGSGINISSGVISVPTVTSSANGLMSSSDKTKLDGLSNYTLPSASTSTKGGIKVGNGLAMDGDTLNVTIKAPCSLTLSETSGFIEKDSTATFTVSTLSDGALSVKSSNTSVATVSISGTTVTVTGKGYGRATITVSQAAGTNYTAPESQTYSVHVKSPLNDMTWSQISTISKAGTGDTYWDIGDCKEITLNGNVGDCLTLENETLCVFILHFNYPMDGVAENNIIWGGFKTALTNGVDVALVDSKYGSASMDGTICFNMNHTGQKSDGNGNGYIGTNYGGWKGTDFRYDILGATSQAPSQYNQLKSTSNVGYDATAATLTNPKANTLLAALPSDFRSALRLWTRWLDAVGNKSNVEENIQATIDAVTLLTAFEVQGTRSFANEYEQNHQAQMDYYKNGNSKRKYRHDSTSSAVWWWCASPLYYNYYDFCGVSTDDSASYSRHTASSSGGLEPAFKT